MSLQIYEPPVAMIDWAAFSDCIITNRWGSLAGFEQDMGLSHHMAFRAWHGHPIGVLPFLRICKRAIPKLDPLSFLVER